MYKAMAVDDEIWVLRGLKKQIEQAGAGIELHQSFTQPLQALNALQKSPVDVVFVDIQMAGMSGLQFIERARKISPRALYVIISAYSEFGYAQQAIQLGVKAYLVKPIEQADLEALLGQVREWLDAMEAEKGDAYLYRLIAMHARGLEPDMLMRELRFTGRGSLCCFCDVRANLTLTLTQLVQRACDRTAVQCAMFPSEDGQFRFALCFAPEAELIRLQSHIAGEAAALGLCAGGSDILRDATRLADALAQAQWGALARFISPTAALVVPEGTLTGMELPASVRVMMERTPMYRIGEVIRNWAETMQAGDVAVASVFYQVFELVQILAKRAYSAKLHDLMLTLTSPVSMAEAFGTLDVLASKLIECAALGVEPTHGQVGVERIRAYLDANYSKPLLIGEIAAHLSMDAGYLGRLFRQKQGIGIKEYVNQRRMERAGELLLTTALSVQEVATLCGMPDPFYFTKVFKKHFSVPPAQFKTTNKCK